MSLRLISFLILLGTMPIMATANSNEPPQDNGYYLLDSADDLYWFANHVNSSTDENNTLSAKAKLTANIVVNGDYTINNDGTVTKGGETYTGSDTSPFPTDFKTWTPIGSESNKYSGTFDGQGYTISGLYCSSSSENIGFFSNVSGTVKNVGIIDSYFGGYANVGAITGRNSGDVLNCYNEGYVCAPASGTNATIVGGIVGIMESLGEVSNCYNTGSISGHDRIGGIVGHNNGTILNCYSIGSINANNNLGGIVGFHNTGSISNCYYLADNNTNISGIGYNSGGTYSNVSSKSTAQFASGEVAYLLQGTQETQVWGQNIDIEPKDAYPVLNGEKVYKSCNNNVTEPYSNTLHNEDHVLDENGFCSVCGAYEEPSQVENVYQIANAGNLYWFAALVNGTLEDVTQNSSANAKLIANVTVNEDVLKANGEPNAGPFRGWTPIGSSSTNTYHGTSDGNVTFDGNNKTISGLYYSGSGSYVGLFGAVESATIKNLGVVDSYFEASSRVGGIVGNCAGTTVSNCYNTSSVKATTSLTSYVGGIVGYSFNSALSKCYNTGSVTANSSNTIGSIVGSFNNGTISYCYYLEGTASKGIGNGDDGVETTTSKTYEEFASGAVAYLLQKAQTSQVTVIWGQNIDNTQEVQFYPVLNGSKVYEVNCTCSSNTNDVKAYSNSELTSVAHAYVNGFCTFCAVYQPATKYTDDVHLIANAGNLYWFANHVNSCEGPTSENYTSSANAKLTANITVNQNVLVDGELNTNTEIVNNFRDWTPIGTESYNYSGTFDGNNKTISGLYYNGSEDHVGLFRYIKNATVKNLGIVDSYIKSSNNNVGAIAAYNEEGDVLNCFNEGYVRAYSVVGGIVGRSISGKVNNCYNSGTICVENITIGGIVGTFSDSNNEVTNCHNSGKVISISSGTAQQGGIVGLSNNDMYVISNCYYLKDENINQNINGIGRRQDQTVNPPDQEGVVVSKNCAQFASGEVAYLLQNAQTSQETVVWGQNIDIEPKDAYPVLNAAKVYKICNDYSNTMSDNDDHVLYENGFCSVCGAYEKPSQVGDVYQIANAGNLYWFAALVNGTLEDVTQNTSANAKLTANITVNQNVLVNGELNTNTEIVNNFRDWTPIGDNNKIYTGSFDGQGHTISGLYYDNDESNYVGLFGYINSSIINIGVIDSYFKADDHVGGIVGGAGIQVSISDCYVNSNISGDSFVGGIAGVMAYQNSDHGTISNCYNSGSISGNSFTGGIVGSNGASVSNCYNSGSISGSYQTGAIVGNNYSAGNVTNCYYLEGTASKGIGSDNSTQTQNVLSKTSAQFVSGEVAYLLQNAQTSQDPVVWGQNIDNGLEKQDYPVFSDAKVSQGTCGTNIAYTNVPGADHAYVNGICACGAYQPAIDSDEDGYYEIANAGNLYWFAAYVNSSTEENNTSSADAKLTANITVNQNVLVNGELNSEVSGFRPWTPIGKTTAYKGTFDGDNHTISGLYYNNTVDNVGLFGFVDSGSVKNVGVIDSYFKANDHVGAIIANFANNNSSTTATVSNCYNTGVCQGNKYVAGLVGQCSRTTITNCYNTGSVRGGDECGGIVGAFLSKEITNCFNYGNITVTNNGRKGAIAAYTTHGTASNCYYLEGTASKGIGNKDDAVSTTTSKTYEEFASGEVAYLLQNAQTSQDPVVWGQNIDNGQEKQDFPVLSDAKVYYINGSYTNNYISETIFWTYEDGILTIHGIGLMRGFGANETKPWSSHLSDINTVVVKAKITGIGDNAFSDIENLQSLFYYKYALPTNWGVNWIKSGSTVYVPSVWNNFNVEGCTVVLMPTYTSNGWSTTPDANSHVVLNGDLVLGQQSKSNSQSLTVSSFGLAEYGSLTIKDGGQLTCSLANGEVTVEKNITGNASTPNWYTISSPLKESVYATSVTNLIDATATNYALYRYDEPSFTWQNYKYKANNFNTLDAGRGYLYARSNSEVTTLQFTGDINTKPVEYKLTANGSTLSGIHLVGNPFTHDITYSNFTLNNAELASGYYVLTNQGAWGTCLANTDAIQQGQGALIKASVTNAANEATLTINPNATTNVAKGQQPRANSQQPMLALNVTNGNYSDRAFVIFGKGIGLDKINHQNEDIPVLYIPMSDADYAIAMMDENVNEIPVGFESSSMGEFTISLRQENCEFKELYLLDKETGAKVNILEQDYTFMATSGDNPDRFILVKSQGSQPEAQSNFAYINNGDVVIYGIEGNAQIDIYDVLGRHVYNANGSDDVHIVTTDGYSAGVYVIRLMDENGLRTQKVIID